MTSVGLCTQTALTALEVSPPTEEFRSKQQQPELLLLHEAQKKKQQLSLLPPPVDIEEFYVCLCYSLVFVFAVTSGGRLMKEPLGVFSHGGNITFPAGAVETRAALTSLSRRLSAGTMSLYLSLCAQILNYREEQKEEETEGGWGGWRRAAAPGKMSGVDLRAFT